MANNKVKTGFRVSDKYNVKYTINGKLRMARTSFGTKAEAEYAIQVIKKKRPEYKNPHIVISKGYK